MRVGRKASGMAFHVSSRREGAFDACSEKYGSAAGKGIGKGTGHGAPDGRERHCVDPGPEGKMISLAQPHIKDDFTAMMHWKRLYEYEHEARLLLEAEKIVLDVMPEKCSCGSTLCLNGYEESSVMDYIQGRTVVKIFYRRKGKCAACGKRYVSPLGEAAPSAFYTNKLLAHAAVEHYILGHSMGEVSAKLNASESALFNAFHLYAEQLTPFIDELIVHYRQSQIKHADETGWKCDGVNGYAWLFTNSSVAVHCFAHTRSQSVVDKIFGDKKLPGVLCVDSYAGYNHVKCKVQYCYAHLKRTVDDLKKEFQYDAEVLGFVNVLSPLLGQAMGLRGKKLDTAGFLAEAHAIKERILQAVNAEANHPGIQKIQNIFRENELKLFHWAESPDVPADNNFAERDLRKTVIARKISYGSQSERGRKTRSVLMSILHTAQKNGRDPATAFEKILRELQSGNRSGLLNLLL